VKEWDAAAFFTEGSWQEIYVVERILAGARSGEYTRAVAEAREMLAELPKGHVVARLSLARVFAQASAAAVGDANLSKTDREKRSDEYAREAVRVIGESLTGGTPQHARFILDDDAFDPLRSREDFRSLVEEIREARQPPGPLGRSPDKPLRVREDFRVLLEETEAAPEPPRTSANGPGDDSER
jgi:hypothetical protein